MILENIIKDYNVINPVKVLYSSNIKYGIKSRDNSSLFGDIIQSRYRKNIVYECGFTLIVRHDPHTI